MSKLIHIVVLAIVLGGFCGGLGGCVSDTGAGLSSISQKSDGGVPLRYYGGPKSPMWPGR